MTIPSQVNPTAVLGPVDEVLRELEKGYPDLTILARGNTLSIMSHSAESEASALDAESFVSDLIDAAASGSPLDGDAVRRLLDERRSASFSKGKGRGISGLKRRVVRQVSGDTTMSSGRRSTTRHAAASQQPAEQRSASQRQAATAFAASLQSRESQDPSHPDALSDLSQDRLGGRLPRVITFALGVPVRPKTPGQIEYVDCIDRNVITFGIGPAGTGKTYLAVAKAVQAFESKQVRRIILTRPAVEAGENLGFLPGTLSEKIDPYLRPLYDALSDMLGSEQLKRYISDGTIEVAPLAYMRGRTLNDAFVILDEAQNTTEQQMKMFLTRLGFNTTMVVTGDVTQVDLGVTRSGLKSIESILGDISTIKFVHLGAGDVVRHSLVGKIVKAYEQHAEQVAGKEKA
ncbi:MAG: PhoH family protein [Bifidobacteriaceae bacterium]|jgi:phosphate starvation-inducible PhoH-like protein|nr:PhoH family protein [Bifidobacteriaceae bacterium]